MRARPDPARHGPQRLSSIPEMSANPRRRSGGRRAGGAADRRPPVSAAKSRSDLDSAPATVAVRVKPGASRDRVGGRYDGPHGPALVVAVTAPAVDGRATEAVRRALASALELRPAAVTLRVGATSRDKVFTVEADAESVAARVRDLRDGSPR